MFTGIVEELGEVAAVESLKDAARLTIRARIVGQDVSLGDSISVNGVCLTVTGWDGEADATRLNFDVMAESLNRSSLGELQPRGPGQSRTCGDGVHPAGGHMVQGHVDAIGTIAAREPAEHWDVVRITAPRAVTRYLVEKGSVTVDGVSLTVTASMPAASASA